MVEFLGWVGTEPETNHTLRGTAVTQLLRPPGLSPLVKPVPTHAPRHIWDGLDHYEPAEAQRWAGQPVNVPLCLMVMPEGNRPADAVLHLEVLPAARKRCCIHHAPSSPSDPRQPDLEHGLLFLRGELTHTCNPQFSDLLPKSTA